MTLYPDFLHHVSVEDLRLRFFGGITELRAAEIDKLTDSTTGTKWLSSRSTKTQVTCSGLYA